MFSACQTICFLLYHSKAGSSNVLGGRQLMRLKGCLELTVYVVYHHRQ